MDWASLIYLGFTAGLFCIFLAIVVRTYSRKRKGKLEEAKHRMLEDD